jgi:hypothetical protein
MLPHKKDSKRGRHDGTADDLHPLLSGGGCDGLYPLYDFDFVRDAIPAPSGWRCVLRLSRR